MYRLKFQPLMWWYLDMGLWEVIKVKWGPEGGVLIMGLYMPLYIYGIYYIWHIYYMPYYIIYCGIYIIYHYKKRHQRAWFLCVPSEKATKGPFAKERALSRSWSLNFKLASFLQKCKKINFCCLKIPSHGNFYGNQSQLIEKGFSTFPNHLIVS